MKIFLVVCNDSYVAKSYFSSITDNSEICIPEPLINENISQSHEEIFSSWKDNVNNQYHYYLNSQLSETKYNVIYVPFSGFLYRYLADKLFKTDNRYTIISINESCNTRLVKLGLYNILLSSRFITFPIEVVKNIIDRSTENNLISSDMDSIMNIIRDEEIPQATEYFQDIKELVLTSE